MKIEKIDYMVCIVSDELKFIDCIKTRITNDIINDSDIISFITTKCTYGLIEILSKVHQQQINSKKKFVYIIDAELKIDDKQSRKDLGGIEIAIALRTINKIRFIGPVLLVGDCTTESIEKKYDINLNEYGLKLFRWPLQQLNIESEIKEHKGQHHTIFAQRTEYHLIGLIDDHYSDFDKSIEIALKKDENYYKVFSFPYLLEKDFEGNVSEIKHWLKYTHILDLLLLDINFDKPNKKEQSIKCSTPLDEDIDRGGLEILSHLEEIAYSVPVVMLSVSKNIEIIKNITLEYKHLIADYVPVKSILNLHSKRDIQNVDFIKDVIHDNLKKTGAKRNKLGILITHGTDTMSWTLSLLKYSLKGLNCNIVLTGSQVPLKAAFSPTDATANIIAALHFLNQCVPPQIGVTFDMGKKFFTDNLKKVRIWNENAFDGKITAIYNWQDIETDQKMLSFNNCLNNLMLVTTGGTIGMSTTHGGTTGTPSDDALTIFFNSSAKYREPIEEDSPLYVDYDEPYKVVSIDSSEMNPGIYTLLFNKLKEINLKRPFVEYIDTDFRWDVYPILCSPFLKNTDYKIYEKFIGNKKQPVVFILLGYGAGNLPFDEEKGYTPMTFVKEAVKENIVLLTSHVQMEIPDLDYDVSIEFIKVGALFGCDMSLAEIMIKSAYLLGHYNPDNRDNLCYLKSAILSGVGFRSRISRRRYLGFINELPDDYKYLIPDKNYFQQLPYEEAKKALMELI